LAGPAARQTLPGQRRRFAVAPALTITDNPPHGPA
jgi:hypothetical protein